LKAFTAREGDASEVVRLRMSPMISLKTAASCSALSAS
jgi:hypothetical protein